MARSGRPFSEMLIGLSLDGSQFQDTMANINKTIKASESVMKANLKVLGNAEKSYDDLSKHMDNLTDVYTAQEKKLGKLEQAHREAIETYGEGSKEAQKYAGQINNTVGAMATMDRQMKNTKREMIYVEEGVNDLTKEFKDHDKQMKTMVDSYKKAGNETAAYEEKQKGLSRQIDTTERAIEAQRKVMERMNTEFGESSEEARKAADSLRNLEDRSRLLGSELSTTNTRLSELGQGSNALISEQQNLVRQLDRTRSAIADQERAVDDLRQAFGEGSREVQNAETRLADLRQEAGRTEQSIETLDDRFRNLGSSSNINADGLNEVDSSLDGLNDKAKIVGAAMAAALGATGAAVVSEIDEAIQKIGILQGGIKSYRKSLSSGVKDADFARQSSVYQFDGDTTGKKLENLSTITGFDGPEVGKALNLLTKQYGYGFEQAEELLIKASRGGLTELDELTEYLTAQETAGMSDKDKQDLADYMITGANKAVQSGGARNTDNAYDFYNEAMVRALDTGDSQTDKFLAAGGKDAVEARDQFLKDRDLAKYLRNLDASIKEKQGDDPGKQRKAWVEAVGTQAEMMNYEGIQQLINGKPMKVNVVGEDGQVRGEEVNGKLSKEDKELIAVTNEYDKAMGNVKDTMILFGLTVLPDVNKSLESVNKFISKHKKDIAEAVTSFFRNFKDGFKGVKDALQPVVDFIYDKMYKPLAGFLGMDTSSLEGVSSWVGKIVGALSALALINLPLKGFGLIAKLFGATGPLATFMAKGVVGKATAVASGVLRGGNRAVGGAINAARPSTRAYRRDTREANRLQRTFNSTGDPNSGARADQARMNAHASLNRNQVANQRFPTATGQVRTGIVSRTKSIARRGWEATKADGRRAYNVLSGGPNSRNSGISAGAGIATPEREARVRAAGERHRAVVGRAVAPVARGAKAVGGGVVKGIKGGGKLLGGAMGALGGPVGLILMALPLIIPLIKKLYDNFEPFKTLVDGTWAMLKTFWAWLQPMLAMAGQWIKDSLISGFEKLQPVLQFAWDKLKAFWAWLQPMLITAGTWIKENFVKAFDGIKPVLETIWNVTKTVFNGIWNTVKTVFGFIWPFIQTYLGFIFNTWKTIFSAIGSLVSTVFNGIKNVIWPIIQFIWNTIKTYLTFVFNTWKTIFNGIWNTTKTVWEWIKNAFTSAKERIINTVSTMWSNVKNNFTNSVNFVKTKVSDWVTSFKNKATELKNGVVERVSGLWNAVKNNFSNGISYVKDKIVGFKNSVVDRFRAMKDDAGRMVNDLVDKVKAMPQKMANAIAAGKSALTKGAKTMINGLIGGVEGGVNRVVGGANKVLGWFGVKDKIKELNLARYAKGTPKGGHPGGLAMVNDANGSKYRELVRTPDGEMFIPKGRNVMIDLPKGSEVLDGKQTAKYAGIGHVPEYKKGVGDILSNLWEGTKSKASKGFNKVKDMSKNALDWVTSKVDVQGMLTKAIGKISSISGTINNKMLEGVVGKTVSSATGFLFKKGNDAKAADAGGESGSKYTGKWGAISNRWGVYDYLYNAVMKVVKQFPSAVITSGQRNGAMTKYGTRSDHSSHAGLDISGYGRNGSPKYREMADKIFKDSSVQYVIANNKWKKKSGGGYTNFSAGGHMNHVHVSGYQPGTASARAKKFARGAIVNSPTAGIFGEAGPEALIPLSNGRRTRGLSLLNKAAGIMGQEIMPKSPQGNPELNELKTMVAQQGQMINLLTQLVMKDNSLYLDGREVYNTVESHKNKATIKTNIARGTL